MSVRARRAIFFWLALTCLHAGLLARAQYADDSGAYVQGKLVELGPPEIEGYTPQSGTYTYPKLNLQPAPYGAQPQAGGFNPYGQPMLPQARLINGLVLFGEFLYLKPRGADVPFGVPQDGLLLPGSTPVGAVGMSSINFKPGFRAGAGLKIGDDALLSGTYTWFQSSGDNSISASGTNVINPLTMFPGTFNAGFTAQQAAANYAIDFQLIDVDYRAMLICCDRHWIRYIAGASYGRLVQNFSVNYPFAPPDGTTSVATSSNFQGAGLLLGLDGERLIMPNRGFSVYGRGLTRLLAGDFRSNYTQSNQFNGVEVQTSLRDYRILPILDVEAGVAWTSQSGLVRLSGGYLVSVWFNTLTTPDWIQAVQTLDFNGPSDTLTFDGLVARGELRF